MLTRRVIAHLRRRAKKRTRLLARLNLSESRVRRVVLISCSRSSACSGRSWLIAPFSALFPCEIRPCTRVINSSRKHWRHPESTLVMGGDNWLEEHTWHPESTLVMGGDNWLDKHKWHTESTALGGGGGHCTQQDKQLNLGVRTSRRKRRWNCYVLLLSFI